MKRTNDEFCNFCKTKVNLDFDDNKIRFETNDLS